MVAACRNVSVSSRRPGVLERIRDTGLIAVLRGIDGTDATAVVDALRAAGVTVIEFTADTPDALELIRQEHERVGDEAAIGLGTVLDVDTAQEAIEAGATFVVTPTVKTEVIERCGHHGVPIIAGAYTPTEAVRAMRAGADMVKVFPASTGGPGHVRALQGPLSDIPLVPTGGVTAETADDYLSNGATAVGVGGGLFPQGALEGGRYDEITTRAERILEAVHR